jgi:Uma2 family endonuclease
MSAVPKERMTYAEYLAAEAKSDVRHEYLRGEVWAMAGGTIEHARLQSQLIASLTAALAGKPCIVLTSDARVRVVSTGLTTYPDVSVVCGKVERDREDAQAVTNPVIVIEVLSEATEAYDRGDKFIHYRRIPSLREYVLVSQTARRIEVFRRDGDFWVLSEAGPGQSAKLASLEIALSVDAIYQSPLPE